MVRERILRGDAPPGTVLSRRRLADELQMSLLPVSDALKRLESEGLVESRSRAGTRVRIPSRDEVIGRSVVREALETQSALLCCERATFQERLELRRMAEQLDALYVRSADRGAKDAEFLHIVHTHHLNLHMQIAEFARCTELKEAIEKNHVLIYNWFYDVAAGRSVLPEHFHSTLVKAITGYDIGAATQTMREHVRYGLESVLEAIGPNPQTDWRTRR